MEPTTQGHLDYIEFLRQEGRRIANEQAEFARRSTELSIQRCQIELGITDPTIVQDIATEVLRAEEEERIQMTAVRVWAREVHRLLTTGGQPLPGQVVDPAGRIRDAQSELTRTQMDLTLGQQVRRERLRRLINMSRTESTRIQGRECGFTLVTEIMSMRAAGRPCDGVGVLLPWGSRYIRVGEANDYLTIHNPNYPRGSSNGDLASRFRNIKLKGTNITICALKNSHGIPYGTMMQDPKEFSWSKPELGLINNKMQSARDQPVAERFRSFALDAGRGRGYAFAVQSQGDDDSFHGIASYNNISDVSPNEFFGSEHMGDEKCRMVDFNFQLISGTLPMERAVEVGTLLIEHARYYFGARLFRSECHPLNTSYIDIMDALELKRFHTVEPASYNPELAAATWKFDLWAWKAIENDLRFYDRWFMPNDTIQADPQAASKLPIHRDPEEPLPRLAVVNVTPTVFEDPAAFEPIGQPSSSAHPDSGSVQWPQGSESMESSSSGSYLSGTTATATNDSGSSSGLGYSESSRSRSTSSGFRVCSGTGSSSGSSSSILREASAAPGAQDDEQTTHSPEQENTRRWQECAAMKALREEEASRAMPPPKLPRRLTMSSQQSSSSRSSVFSDFSDITIESMELDSQYSTSPDAKGKQPASSPWPGQPSPSTMVELPAQRPYEQEGRGSVPGLWSTPAPRPAPGSRLGCGLLPGQTNPSMAEASQALVPHGRTAKRPASVSWDTQPKRPSKMHQSQARQGTDSNDSSSSVTHHTEAQPLDSAPDQASPQAAGSEWSDRNQQLCRPSSAVGQPVYREATSFSSRPNRSETTSASPQSPVAWYASQSSPPHGGSTRYVSAFPQQASLLCSTDADGSTSSPAGTPSAGGARPVGADAVPATYDQQQAQSTGVSPVSTVLLCSVGSQFGEEKPRGATSYAPNSQSHAVYSPGLTSNALRFTNTTASRPPSGPRVSIASQATEIDSSEHQQPARARQEQKPPKPQVYPSSTRAQLPSRPGGSSFRNMRQISHSRLQYTPLATQSGPGTRGPARGVTKPQQKSSRGSRKSALAGGQTKVNKSANTTSTKKSGKLQQTLTRVVSNPVELLGTSSVANSQLSQGRLNGGKKSPVSEPAKAPQVTAVQPRSLDILLRNIALTTEPYVASTSKSVFDSGASHQTGEHQPSAMINAGTASQEISSKYLAPQRVTQQKMTAQGVTSPRAICSPESRRMDESKRRPWQL